MAIFKKIVAIDVKQRLDAQYLERVEKLCEKLVLLEKNSPEIEKEIADCDCILSSFLVAVDKKLIEKAAKLKYIGVLATAYGKIDSEHARKKGITVTNIPGYSTNSVAEFVIGTLLDNIRQLEKAKRQARDGNYSEAGFRAREIRGKNFGIIGLGSIGRRVAQLAKGFGADVFYWSKNIKKLSESGGANFMELDKLLEICDFISVNVSLNKQTENLLDKTRISRIRKEAVLINTAPMEVLDLHAVEARLKKGDMSFILDHSDEMKAEDASRLVGYENCSVYPPIGYISDEASKAKQEIFVSNMKSFLAGKPENTV